MQLIGNRRMSTEQQKLFSKFNLKYDPIEQSFTFLIYNNSRTTGLQFKLCYRKNEFSAQEYIYKNDRWSRKFAAKEEIIRLDEHGMADYYTLHGKFIQILGSFKCRISDFSQKFFTNETCSLLLKEIISEASKKDLLDDNADFGGMSVNKQNSTSAASLKTSKASGFSTKASWSEPKQTDSKNTYSSESRSSSSAGTGFSGSYSHDNNYLSDLSGSSSGHRSSYSGSSSSQNSGSSKDKSKTAGSEKGQALARCAVVKKRIGPFKEINNSTAASNHPGVARKADKTSFFSKTGSATTSSYAGTFQTSSRSSSSSENFFSMFFSFFGTISRLDFWIRIIILGFLFFSFGTQLFDSSPDLSVNNHLFMGFLIVFGISFLSLAVRRLADFGLSKATIVLLLIPPINLVLIYMMFFGKSSE